ncbi:TPA: YqjD family protein [Pseudomonas aeruginosa]
MPRKTTANAAKDELLAEFQALVADTEKLLQSTADVAGDQAEEIRGKIHDSLKRARDTLRDTKDSLKDNVRERSQAAVDATEVYVSEHPWQSIGIAAGVGFLLGLLVSRR